MDLLLLLKAAVMGVVEGLTEFLPVSSTGHLILFGKLLDFPANIEATFEIFIQLGAILAVVAYFARDLAALLGQARRGDPPARRLLVAVAIAFVPAAAAGYVLSDLIKERLFNPVTVGAALVLGGVAMLGVERWFQARQPRVDALARVGWGEAVKIGLAQIVALFPGMSRSAWTIMGGMLAGLDRPTALRFSFYLSIPTMIVATTYDLLKSMRSIRADQLPAFAVGLVVSFLVALVVVKFFLGYVAKHDLKPFAYYRIAAGLVIVAVFALARP